MEAVSYLTINGETREIVDSKSRRDIVELQEQIEYLAELQGQIEYLAEQLNITFPEVEEN